MIDLLSSALALAERGWHVFPVNSDKKPLSDSNGWKDGTTDPEKIGAMRWGEAAGIGIATGPSSLFVLDVDPPEGQRALDKLVMEHGQLPVTFTTRTPRGGLHYYFRRASEVPESASRVGPNLDIKASSGYVVGPGSVNAEGKSYNVVVDEDPAPTPGWLVARALNGHAKKSMLSNGSAPDGKIPEGQRHAERVKLAGAMRRQGASEGAIVAALLADNKARCAPPDDESAVIADAKDICGRYKPAAAMVSPAETLMGAAEPPKRRRSFRTIIEAMKDAPPPHAITTGVPALDSKLGEANKLAGLGWVLGRLAIIAAYVGSYKTRGLLTYALSALEAGARVLFISAEMIAEELARIVGENFPDGVDMEVLDQTYDLAQVEREIHDFSAEGDGRTSIVFLDYAQVLSNAAEARSREREVASITRALSRLARSEGVAIVATAQLNRASQTDDAPKLSHLRESGALEADADVVLVTVYDRPRLSIVCKKHRFGFIDWEVHLKVDADTCTFSSYSDADVAVDRLDRIQEAVEKRVLASGPTHKRELYQSIRVGGQKARAYEIASVVTRSPLVEFDQEENVRPRIPGVPQ